MLTLSRCSLPVSSWWHYTHHLEKVTSFAFYFSTYFSFPTIPSIMISGLYCSQCNFLEGGKCKGPGKDGMDDFGTWTKVRVLGSENKNRLTVFTLDWFQCTGDENYCVLRLVNKWWYRYCASEADGDNCVFRNKTSLIWAFVVDKLKDMKGKEDAKGIITEISSLTTCKGGYLIMIICWDSQVSSFINYDCCITDPKTFTSTRYRELKGKYPEYKTKVIYSIQNSKWYDPDL